MRYHKNMPDMPSADKYAFQVFWSEEDQEHIATCLEFPSLSWLAPTSEKALAGLQKLISEVLEDMRESGETIPEPLSTRKFSGKFNLRIGPELHRRLAMEAASEHLSLNQYALKKLSQV